MIGGPASTWMMDSGAKVVLISSAPEAKSRWIFESWVIPTSTYCTSVNPSRCKNSSATYCGGIQMPGFLDSLTLVVSGGGSAATGLGYQPRSPAVPASVTPPRNLRRLNGRAGWVLIGPSLPDTGQCDREHWLVDSSSIARTGAAPNEEAQQRRPPVRQDTPKNSDAAAVCCSGWFGGGRHGWRRTLQHRLAAVDDHDVADHEGGV